MTEQKQERSVTQLIAQVQAAQQSGLLAAYVPAKAAVDAEQKLPASWGPAMRI